MLNYEDNFGFWDIREAEERVFFDHVQLQSVMIACTRCERAVRLIPPRSYAPPVFRRLNMVRQSR